mgnify:CR=1 FL=1
MGSLGDSEGAGIAIGAAGELVGGDDVATVTEVAFSTSGSGFGACLGFSGVEDDGLFTIPHIVSSLLPPEPRILALRAARRFSSSNACLAAASSDILQFSLSEVQGWSTDQS